MSADALTAEQLDHYYEMMPALAAAHASDGIFTPLATNPALYRAQLPENGWIEAHPDAANKRPVPPAQLADFGKFLVSNVPEMISELHSLAAPLLRRLVDLRYNEGKNVLWVGNHPEFDSIIYPIACAGLAGREISPAIDVPSRRITVMAKPLAWYDAVLEPAVEVVRNISNVALTAPGTESGSAVDRAVRDYINAQSVPMINDRLDEGMQEVALAFSGSTDKLIGKKIGLQRRLQYPASKRTYEEFLLREDVVVVPFATHRPADGTKRMVMSIGSPRQMQSIDDCDQLGEDIAHLSYRASGIITVQTKSKEHYRQQVADEGLGETVRELFAQARNYAKPFEDRNGGKPIIVGQAA